MIARVSFFALLGLAACSSAETGTATSSSSSATATASAGSTTGAGGAGGSAGATTGSGDTSTGVGGSGGTPQAMKDVFIIGGQDERRLLSADGVTWTHDVYIAPNGLDNAFTGVAIGGDKIVIAGDPGVWTSLDGALWTHQLQKEIDGHFHSAQAAYGAGKYVFVSGKKAFRSPDGVAWEVADGTGDSGHWHGMAFGGGHFVAVGDGHRKVSEDGLVWHDYVTAENFTSVLYAEGKFIAVGDKGVHATSTDGAKWNIVADAPEIQSPNFEGIAFGKGIYVAIGSGSSFTSPDGLTWTKTAGAISCRVVFGAGRFVCAGWRSIIRTSDDGVKWEIPVNKDKEPSQFDPTQLSPWFTGLGVGQLPAD